MKNRKGEVLSLSFSANIVAKQGVCGRDHIVVEFTTTCAMSAYHH